MGRLDEAGYLRVTGRIKDSIIRGGFNISAYEVEEARHRRSCLSRHPGHRNARIALNHQQVIEPGLQFLAGAGPLVTRERAQGRTAVRSMATAGLR